MRRLGWFFVAVVFTGTTAARADDEAQVRAWVATLQDTRLDEHARGTAAFNLGLSGRSAKSAVPALLAAMNDPLKHVRQKAADALLQIEPQGYTGSQKILEQVRMETAEQRAATASRLGSGPYSKEAIGALVGMLGDEDAKVRQAAAVGLMRFGKWPEWSRPLLAEALGDENPDWRATAGAPLGIPGSDPASRIARRDRMVAAATGLLKEDNVQFRRAAAAALATLAAANVTDPVAGLGPARPEMLAALNDTDPEVRKRIAKVLLFAGETSSLQSPGAAQALAELLASRGDPDRDAAAAALRRMSSDSLAVAVPALLSVLKDKTDPLRAAAVEMLGRTGADRAIRADKVAEVLIGVLKDPRDHEREAAIKALGGFGPADAPVRKMIAGALVEVINSPDDPLQLPAVDAIAVTGDEGKAAAPRLAEMVRTGTLKVRGKAAYALGCVAPSSPESAAVLLAAVRAKDTLVRSVLAPRLNHAPGNESVIEELRRILRETPDPAMRMQAWNALDEIGQPLSTPQPEQASAAATRPLAATAPTATSPATNPASRPVDLAELPPAVRRALATIQDERADSRAKAQACNVLGGAALSAGVPEAAVPVLTAHLSDRHEETRSAAARALGSMGVAARGDADQKLWDLAVKDPDLTVRRVAGEARAQIWEALAAQASRQLEEAARAKQRGQDQITQWVQMLGEDDLKRAEAFKQLKALGPQAAPALVEGIRTGNSLARRECGDLLVELGPAAASSAASLGQILADREFDPNRREIAASVLGHMGEGAAGGYEALAYAIASDPSPAVHDAAFQSVTALHFATGWPLALPPATPQPRMQTTPQPQQVRPWDAALPGVAPALAPNAQQAPARGSAPSPWWRSAATRSTEQNRQWAAVARAEKSVELHIALAPPDSWKETVVLLSAAARGSDAKLRERATRLLQSADVSAPAAAVAAMDVMLMRSPADVQTRVAAAQVLAAMAGEVADLGPDVTSAMAAAMVSELRNEAEETAVRRQAAVAVGLLGRRLGALMPSAIEGLTRLVNDRRAAQPAQGKPDAAAQASRQLRSDAVAALARLALDSGQPRTAAAVLANIVSQRSDPARAIAVAGLARLGPAAKGSGAEAALAVALADRRDPQRRPALEALAAIDPQGDESTFVQTVLAAAADVADELNPAAAEWVSSHRPAVDQAGAQAAAFSRATARQELLRKLAAGPTKDRVRAAYALGRVDPTCKEAADALLKAVKEKDFAVRVVLAPGLKGAGPRAADLVARLQELALNDPDRGVRANAWYALHEMGAEVAWGGK